MIPNKLVNSHYGPMIINGNDRYIGASIAQFGAWAADDIELIKSILDVQLLEKDRVVFFDIGANIGTHSVALARHFGKKISVRSFEAQRQMYYLLCGNVALNGLDNVICEQLAVSDTCTNTIPVLMPDYTQPNNFGGFELTQAVFSDNNDMIKKDFELVKTVTIDHYCESVDFIKLDIEGMEHTALQGATNTIACARPICFVEVLKSDKSDIKNFFQPYDYILYEYKSDDWIFVPADSDVELDLPKFLL